MKASYVKETINPSFPCKMEGYNEARFCFNQTAEQKAASKEGLRTAFGQRDDLFLDVLCIQANQLIVFYQLDICIIESEFAFYCKQQIMNAFPELTADQISMACSHTHNSPVVSHGMDGSLHPDKAYWKLISEKMISGLRQCLLNLKDVRISYDQHQINGYYNNRNRPDEEYYDKCDELRFDAIDGQPILRLLNLACHPTILGAQNMLVTADFFGVMRRYLQAMDGYPVMVCNGEAGDSSPRLLKKGVDWNECLRYGEGIGAQLVYPNKLKELQVEHVDIQRIDYTIDYEPKKNSFLLDLKAKLEHELKTLDSHSDRYDRITKCYLYDVNEKLSKDHIHYETTSYVYDFKSFRIVCVPCEIDTVLGKRIREADDKLTFLISYSNGFHYYAVNAKEYGVVFESFNTYFAYEDADKMVDCIIETFR